MSCPCLSDAEEYTVFVNALLATLYLNESVYNFYFFMVSVFRLKEAGGSGGRGMRTVFSVKTVLARAYV